MMSSLPRYQILSWLILMESAQKVDLESGMDCYAQKSKSEGRGDQKSTKSAESAKF